MKRGGRTGKALLSTTVYLSEEMDNNLNDISLKTGLTKSKLMQIGIYSILRNFASTESFLKKTMPLRNELFDTSGRIK